MKCSRWRFAVGLAVLALGLRLMPANIRFAVGTDEAAYLTLARNLAEGRGFTLDGARPHTEFDPGYPLAASIAYRLGGGQEFPAQANVMLGGLAALPAYFLARRMYGEAAARRAGLLTALLPALVLSVPNFGASSEQVYTVCVWLGMLALWIGLEAEGVKRLTLLAVAGLAFGWAHLTRWEGAVYAVVGAAWIAWGGGPRRRLAGLLALGVAFAAVATPYALYLQQAQGTWFSSKATTQQIQGEAVATDDPLAWERAYGAYEQARDAPDTIAEWAARLWANRDAEIRLYARNWLKQLALPFTAASFLAVLWAPFAGLAWLRPLRDRVAVRPAFFIASACAPLLLFPVAFVDPRYWLPLAPGLLIWAGEGLTRAEEWLRVKFERQRLQTSRAWLLTAALCAAFALADVAGVFLVPAPVEYKALGLWMSANGVAKGETVLARKRQVPFYAGARWEWLPLTDTAGLLEYAAGRGARYVVVDERTVPALRPDLAYLLDPAEAPANFALVAQASAGGMRVLLYEILEGSAPPGQ